MQYDHPIHPFAPFWAATPHEKVPKGARGGRAVPGGRAAVPAGGPGQDGAGQGGAGQGGAGQGGGGGWQDGGMTWIAPVPKPVDGPLTGDHRPMLEGYLDWQRVTLLNICSGLTAEQLASRPIPSTSLSLLGLVRHMAKVERIWFRQRIVTDPVEPLYDPALGKDADFELTGADHASADFACYEAEVALARNAARGIPFDHTFDVGGETWSVRMVHVHMIGEYSRHNGHADLLREAIDGVQGR
jgi:uncharacterized damage-inducible protein DinB